MSTVACAQATEKEEAFHRTYDTDCLHLRSIHRSVDASPIRCALSTRGCTQRALLSSGCSLPCKGGARVHRQGTPCHCRATRLVVPSGPPWRPPPGAVFVSPHAARLATSHCCGDTVPWDTTPCRLPAGHDAPGATDSGETGIVPGSQTCAPRSSASSLSAPRTPSSVRSAPCSAPPHLSRKSHRPGRHHAHALAPTHGHPRHPARPPCCALRPNRCSCCRHSDASARHPCAFGGRLGGDVFRCFRAPHSAWLLRPQACCRPVQWADGTPAV
jgi:hypothetical protein